MKSINTIENVLQKSLVERSIWGLREAYLERGGKEEWVREPLGWNMDGICEVFL